MGNPRTVKFGFLEEMGGNGCLRDIEPTGGVKPPENADLTLRNAFYRIDVGCVGGGGSVGSPILGRAVLLY